MFSAENGGGIADTGERFAAAYDDGVERLSAAVEAAAAVEGDWDARLSAGLRAGLEFLAADPPLARLLLVEALAAARPVRLEHERRLEELGEALHPPLAELSSAEQISHETERLLAGGIVSYLSGRVLGGEAEKLPDAHDFLLRYLLAPARSAEARRSDVD